MIRLTTRHRALPLYVFSLFFSFFSSFGIAHAQLSPTDTEEFISWVVMMDGANWSTTGNPPFPMNYDQQQVTVIGDICNYPGIECANGNTTLSTFGFAGSETIQIVGELAPFCDFSVFETLQFLTLSRFDDLVGELPNVECLSSLVSFSVSNNNLSGSVLNKGIPGLLELGFLDLNSNAFEGNVPNIQNDGGLTTRLFNNQFDFVPESWTVFKRNIAFNPISVLPSTCAEENVANACQPRTLPRIFQSGNTLISKSDNFPLQWKNISTNTTYPNATGPFTIPCHGTYTVIPDAPNIVGSGETGTSLFNSLTITGLADTLTIDLVDNQVALSDGQNLNIHDLVGGTVLGTLTWGTSPGSFPNAAATPVNINGNTTLYVRDETAAGCVATAQIDIRLATQGPAVYVDDSATGANNGTSWADAYTSLQDALAFKSLSGSSAEIWVAAGTYYPDEGSGYTDGDRMAAFQLRNNLTIYGGFAGDEPADFDVNQRDIDGNPTILSGDIDKDGLLDGENSLHVVFNNENGLDATAVLDGFTISSGLANGERLPHERGGGVLNKGVAPTIRNCTFTGNEARHNGGGMFNYEAAPTVINCLFFENTANLGGAVYNYFHSAPVYTNCTFANNTGLINGAGLYNNFYTNTVVNNSIFWGNTGIQVFNNASTLSINNAIIEGGCPAGYDCTNVSDQDPQFLDAAANNFQLSLTSPAIGASNGAANNTAIDLAGNPRTSSGGALDLGALQNQRAAYVNDDATGSNDGSSWANAFNHLQDALAYAASEPLITQIWIAEGTYTPDQGIGFTAGDRDASFSMQNDLVIYGGFPNTGNPNLTDRDWAANVTILSGDIGTPGVNTDNSRRIIYNNGLNNTAVLDGLTVSDAYNEIFFNGQQGGGMRNDGASPIIQNCIFRNNDVAFNGGAVANFNASPEFTNCLFVENSAFGGGAFNTQEGAVIITNCTFTGNSASQGSAIRGNFFSTSSTLTNCIIWGNLNSGPIFNNQGASTTITYSVVEGGYPGTGNLNSDPLFADATNGDFRLQACSPAIDAGTGTNAPSVDLGGTTRIVNNGIDMGAYEFQSTPTPVIAQCQPRTVELDADGNGSLLASDLNNGSMGCGTLSFDVNSETTLQYSCADVGTVSVQLTVTDDRGQTASCMADIMIEDNVQPTALCQNVTVQLDGAGNASITAADIDGGSTDACGIASVSAAPTAFDCSNVGNNASTLTVTDNNGNFSTCNATVTVEDNVPPTAFCQNITVQLDATGNATITAADVDDGSADNCVIAGLSATPTTFNCSNVGANTVTLTATDVNGNSSSCTATVTVEDNVPPTAVCQNITVQLDATGNATITAADVDDGSADNCVIAGLSATPTTFNCSNVGANTVTLTATDVNGNSSICTATVTVEDNAAPMAVCQDITVQLDANGNTSITAADIDGGSSDACGALSNLSATPTTFNCSNVGANTSTLTVTDANGNSSSCNATVTVEDNVPPVALCQNVTVQLDGVGNASITAADIDGGSNDACGIASVSAAPTAFDCSNVGNNASTLTVTDNNGNSSTCTATVTVEDNVPPTAVCQNVTVQLNGAGNASITAADIDGGSNDACGIANLSAAPNTFNCSNVGANTSTLTVTDVNGNVSTCNATVTVEDNNPPVAICANPTVNLTSDGITTVAASFFDGGSSATCPDGPVPGGSVDFSASMTNFSCDNVGNTYNVTLIVTSQANGQSATCTANVTVADPNSFCCAPPVAVCEDITVQLDASGSASITPSAIGSGSTAQCGLASESLDIMDFGCTDVGENTVTYTITDVNDESGECTAKVIVVDDTAPTAACLNTTVEIQPDGTYELQQSDVYDAANSSDNCPYLPALGGPVPGAIASVSFPATTFDCNDLGLTFPIVVTVTDPSSNMNNCTANVTVDAGNTLPPEWSANDIGNPGSGSDYTYDPCVGNNPGQGDFTISTGGYNLIPQNSDNLAFATVPLCGNGGIQARIESVSGGYGGLMIRESSAPGAKMVAVYSNLTNLLRRETRTVTNGPRTSGTLFAAFPKWLRLVRQGDYIRAFYRNSNGGSWTLFHQAYVPMGNCVEMGLAVFTTDPNGDATAVFSSVNYQSQGGQSLSVPNGLVWEAETPEEVKASVVPNPVRGQFTLQFSKPLPTVGQATLLNEFGQRLLQQPLRAGETELGWDTGALPAGLYFLEVVTGDGYREVLKVVRQ